MAKKITINGKSVRVRCPTAEEYFSPQDEFDKQWEVDVAVMAAVTEDDKGEPAFAREQIRALPITEYTKLYNAVVDASTPKGDTGKN